MSPNLSDLTLIPFDDPYEVWAHALPVAELVPLTRETYRPRDSTALRTTQSLAKASPGLPPPDMTTILAQDVEKREQEKKAEQD